MRHENFYDKSFSVARHKNIRNDGINGFFKHDIIYSIFHGRTVFHECEFFHFKKYILCHIVQRRLITMLAFGSTKMRKVMFFFLSVVFCDERLSASRANAIAFLAVFRIFNVNDISVFFHAARKLYIFHHYFSPPVFSADIMSIKLPSHSG